MMKCKDIQQQFGAWLAGDMNLELHERIRRHVEVCAACQRGLALDRQIAEVLRSQEDVPVMSSDFNRIVLAKAEKIKKPVWKRATAFFIERPAMATIGAFVFSILMILSIPDSLTSNRWGDLFLLFFTSKPIIGALVLAATGWVYYVNEKFLEKMAGRDRN